GPGKQESLQAVASVQRQEVRLCLRLDPFGDDLKIQLPCHGQNQMHDRRVIGIVRRVLDESPVYLQFVERKSLQISQTGVARAEVVDGKTDAQLDQFRHSVYGALHILDQDAFGDFKD